MVIPAEKCDNMSKFRKGESCLPNSWIVVRLDGKQFTRFSDLHDFNKPNDLRALELMNRSAANVMEELSDICLAFGQSDEYSFVFRKDTQLFNRSRDAISTVVSSIFSSAYVYYWNEYFAYTKLLYPPSFDCRVVVYPSDENLRDYLSWRQADVHINNLYNTAFWALVKKGKYDRRKAQQILSGTVSKDKNEMLFNNYGINYNNELIMFRKGTTLIKKLISNDTSDTTSPYVIKLNCDIISDAFWMENWEILKLESLRVYDKPVNITGYRVTNSHLTELELERLEITSE